MKENSEDDNFVELSSDTQIPLIIVDDNSAPIVDLERLSEIEPEDISLVSWEEFLGKDFDFEDLADLYSQDVIYEIEIGIDYAEGT